MAELLVFDRDHTAEWGATGWGVGDVVAVMPDGHQWGRKETGAPFVVVACPEMSVEEAEQVYLAEVTETVDDGTGNQQDRMVARRNVAVSPQQTRSRGRRRGQGRSNRVDTTRAELEAATVARTPRR